MWEAWKMAKAYHRRPSELYGVTDEVGAWCFDRAVFLFGSELESELKEAAEGASSKGQSLQRQQRVMARWFGQQRFRDPASSSGPTKL